MNSPVISIADIRAARVRAAGIVKTTPLDLSATFSARCRRQIYLKLENLLAQGAAILRLREIWELENLSKLL